MLDYVYKNGFLISLGFEVPDIPVQSNKIEYNVLPEKIMKSISRASKNGFLTIPVAYFHNPKFDCYSIKKTSLSIGPDLEML